MKFTELDLPSDVMRGIEQVGFVDLTPVQEESIPLALQGRDVAAQAQTGTGKTAAFLIALFTRLQKNTSASKKGPRALILAPTRELVVQICADANGLGVFCPFKVQPIFGGVDYEKQRTALMDGVDIIVATPGRLIDYAKQNVFSLGHVESLVIDEADRMFDMGFIRDLRYILRKLPPFEKRQTMLFSATLSQRVMELAYEFMNIAEKVRIEPEQVTAERVEQIVYHVSRREKFPLLLGLLKKELEEVRVLVFVNTKREGEHLSGRLQQNSFRVAVLSGDIPQRKRMRILDDFKAGKLNFLVATDVASRGLHIEAVTHVINYDLPQDAEDYVHRIGRTARAGAGGKSISFADEDLAYFLPDIEEYIGQKIPSTVPRDEDLCHDYKRGVPHKKRLSQKKEAARLYHHGGGVLVAIRVQGGNNSVARICLDGLDGCTRCARLETFMAQLAPTKGRHRADYHNAPVNGFGDLQARIGLIGLAPGAHGANRTGRPFTGDGAGKFMYPLLHQSGFSNQAEAVAIDDGLELQDIYITNAVKCLPPENRPNAEEFTACRPYLEIELQSLKCLRVIIALGHGAHKSLLRLFQTMGLIKRMSDVPFSHAGSFLLPNGIWLVGCYHTSRYNVQTGRMNDKLFLDLLEQVRMLVQGENG